MIHGKNPMEYHWANSFERKNVRSVPNFGPSWNQLNLLFTSYGVMKIKCQYCEAHYIISGIICNFIVYNQPIQSKHV